QWTEAVESAEVHLFQPRPAYRVRGSSAERPRAGRNPPNGAILHFSLAEPVPDEVSLAILDAEGKEIRRLSPSVQPGWNRVVWDLRHAPAEGAREGPLGEALPGPKVAPGTYQVRLGAGKKTAVQYLAVLKDPRLATTGDDFRAQEELALRLRDRIEEIYGSVARIRHLREQIQSILDRGNGPLTSNGEALLEELASIEQALVQTKMQLPSEVIDHGPRLDLSYWDLYDVVTGADARPTDGARERFEDLEKDLQDPLSRLRTVVEQDVPALNELAQETGVPAVVVKR
ncbi:MAG: hypothetical protein ACRD21_25235, partial [Vicinamibacteria bacterium]